MTERSRKAGPGAAERRLSAGVEPQPDGTAHARVWAPGHATVEMCLGGGKMHALDPEADGYFSARVPGMHAGTRYWFSIDGGPRRPDPVSRRQPEGPHGPSEVVDPRSFPWTDDAWRGPRVKGAVLYEMHVGTFTPEGTWRSAAAQLESLASLGITIVEMMPVADFSGRFGWGYDGVNLYAPTHLYGTPDDLRAFVDRAHTLGLAVILDVVYNHLGPDGNYLGDYSSDYFTDKYENDWGRAINFEGPRGARDYFVENAVYWIDEFHMDGLRLDATQEVRDGSAEHVIAELGRRARAVAPSRTLYVIAENEPQDSTLVRPPETGGLGLDALWNDDFHHTAVVSLTGRREAYYSDYKGSAQELVSCAKYGFLYQGQWYSWQKQPRGTAALDLPGSSFVTFIENHDQVANSAFGRRLHQLSSPGRYRAITALTLLGPGTPLLFQGQEFASSAPFLYFADHRPELGAAVRRGRREFLEQFDHLRDQDVLDALPSPTDPATFERCKLDPRERVEHGEALTFHGDLLALRRSDPVIYDPARVDGAIVATEAFAIRYFGRDAGDRLLLLNLGCDLDLAPAPEPLIAPPPGARWRLVWSSEAVKYGGQGTPPLNIDGVWHVPGEAALLLASEPVREDGHD